MDVFVSETDSGELHHITQSQSLSLKKAFYIKKQTITTTAFF